MEKKRFKRSQFAVVLVLAPSNNTFERKCLIVPFAPDALKLGRQTTARTAAATDNGYFDSRVLSRQHAEIWAERETGQVWLRDCKSSNGTYINKQRSSPENTESEPFESKRNDELDLGIDIISNDDAKQMYRKISARVEKISMLLSQMNDQTGQPSIGGAKSAPKSWGIKHLQQPYNGNSAQTAPNGANSSANGANNAINGGTPGGSPAISRKPSLETSKNVNTRESRNSEAVFGSAASSESLALNYASTTAGMLVRDSVKSHVEFELAAKRLVAQIRAVRADTAKLESLASLLGEIKQAALDAEREEKQERENFEKEKSQIEAERAKYAEMPSDRPNKMKSSSIAASKAENARFRAERASYSKRNRSRSMSIESPFTSSSHNSPSSANSGPNGHATSPNGHVASSSAGFGHAGHSSSGNNSTNSPNLSTSAPDHGKTTSHSHIHGSEKRPTARHNVVVSLGTASLVTIVGVVIMFFFNPPVAPSNHTPPSFDFIQR